MSMVLNTAFEGNICEVFNYLSITLAVNGYETIMLIPLSLLFWITFFICEHNYTSLKEIHSKGYYDLQTQMYSDLGRFSREHRPVTFMCTKVCADEL